MDAARSSTGNECGERQDVAGQRADLEALFRTEGPVLLRFLRSRTRYPEDAADLLQETFSRFARASTSVQLDNPAAYLQRIASNLLINWRQKAEHRVAHLPLEFVQLVDPTPSPHEQLEARQALERLDACLARLRPKTREIFLLHRVEGLTYTQIGARVGLSARGVEKHISKAMVHLDRQLGRR